MESGNNGIDKRKMSFGFSLGDERIKLIDIVSEDDHFLVASHFSDSGRIEHNGEQALFRLSGFGCSQDAETIQAVHNRVPGEATEGRRSSFMRRSLAWDTAFTNSAGVLDPDELSLINKGFGAGSHLLPVTHGVRKRRPESEVPLNDGSSLNWFEIEPFEKKRPATYRSNSVKGFSTASMSLDLGPRNERLRNSRAARGKEVESFQNKTISSQTAVRKSISLHTEDMKKLLKETTGRSRSRAASSSSSSSVKPPKSWCRSVNDSTTSNRTDILGKSNVKMTRFGPGQSMIPERQSGKRSEMCSTNSAPFTTASLPRASFSSSKRITETEPRKSKVYAPLSTFRGSEKGKGIVNETSHSIHTKSQLKRSTLSSPASYSSQYSSQSLSSSLSKKRKSNVDTKPTDLVPLASEEAAETSSFGPNSGKNFKPSELRPPSPKMGFFEGATGSRGTRRKTHPEGTFVGTKTQFHSSEVLPHSSISYGLSSTCNKLRSGILDTARKIRGSKTYLSKDKEKLVEALKVSDGKRSRIKLGFNSSMEEDKRKDSLKNKRYKGSIGPVIEDMNNTIKKRNGQNVLNGSEDQIGNLSRFFEAIALDQGRNKQLGQKNKTGNKAISVFSKQVNQLIHHSPTRTPLADKSSVCNSGQTRSLQMVP